MAKIPFTFGTGYLSSSSFKLSVYSFEADPVTVLVDGSPVAVSLVGNGTDGIGGATDSSGTYPVALYVGHVDVTGVAEGYHQISVTQNSVTRLGGTDTSIGSVAFVTCDNYSTGTTNGVGAWRAIQDDVEAGLIKHLFFAGDHGYTDGLATNDTGLGGTQRYAGRPDVDNTEYARYLAYAAYMGLMETDVDSLGYIYEFSAPERIFVRENCSKWSAASDHEVINNPEELATVTASDVAAARNVFLNTVASTTPFVDLANSTALVEVYGDMEFTSFDRSFDLVPLTMYYDPALEENQIAANKIISDAQMTDIKASINSTSKYKIVCMPLSFKHMTLASFRLNNKGVWNNTSWFGAQQPLHDYTCDTQGDALSNVSQLRELFTDLSGGICTVAQAYGAPVVALHDDTHRPYEYHHYLPQDANNSELNMIECSSGGVNAAVVQNLHSDITEGYYFRGSTANWFVDWTSRNTFSPADPRATYIRLTVATTLKVEYIQADGVAEQTVLRTTTVESGKPFSSNKNSLMSI